MKADRLGCFTLTGILAALFTFLFVAGVTLVRGGALFSPGALNAQAGVLALGGALSHAEIATCSTCHVAPWEPQSMSDRCLDCHKNIRENPKDFHKIMLAEGERATCRECHTDHHGAEALLTIEDLSGFPHEKLGFSLHTHLKMADGSPFTCSDCHSGTYVSFDKTICETCHRSLDTGFLQDHMATFSPDCLNCHDGRETYGKAFDHSKVSFALTGKHVGLACQDCHQGVQTITDLQAAAQDCTTCHAKDDAHGGRFGMDCGSCHTPEGWKPAKFDHNLADFKLTGKHGQVECQKCHIDGKYTGIPKDCFSCHAQNDVHAGQLSQDCSSCHNPQGWKPSTFDHTLAAFQLLGKHAGVQCENCHTNKIFKGTPQDCASCHVKDDAHKGQFGNDCGLCHNPQGWKSIFFDHSLTAFQLIGKHGSVACLDCHTGGPIKSTPSDCYACHAKDDQHGGQFGNDCKTCHTPQSWSQVTFDHSRAAFQLTGAHIQVNCLSCHSGGKFKGTPQNCYACHKTDDHHNGQFGTDCESCHSTQSWKGATFDHSRTAFQLTGKHTQLACQSCHNSGKFKGTPKDCYSCHAQDDNHGGQFGTDCGTCHTTQSWQGASFDHSRASFQLTGAHVQASCTQCHAGGNFKGTPSACVACHAEPNFHQGVLGTNCAACHNTNRWTPASYNGPHSFPMSHGKPDSCSTCHPSSLGSWTCYACHDQGEIAHKHQEENIGDFSNCLNCHPTGRKEGGGD